MGENAAPSELASQGTVKSYNGLKGMGFITSEGMAGDIIFFRRDLPSDASDVQGKFMEGQSVMFDAVAQPDGRVKATAVQLVAVEGAPIAGEVKSFSERNGYGFLRSTSFPGEDFRFQAGDLVQGSPVATGAKMIFDAVPRPDGKLMAKNLRFQNLSGSQGAMGKGAAQHWSAGDSYGPPRPPPLPPPRPSMPPPAPPASGEVWSGTVKSFSERNGYGFINVVGEPEDVKFSAADLGGLTNVAPGTPVRFQPAFAAGGRVQAREILLERGTKRSAPPFTAPPPAAPPPAAPLGGDWSAAPPEKRLRGVTLLPYARHF